MTPEPELQKQPFNCPPDCDWKEKGFHIERELGRVAISVDKACTRLDTLHEQLEALIKINRQEMDITVRRYIDEATRQITMLSEALRLNSVQTEANRAEIATMKALMARSVAVWASITAAIVSLIPQLLALFKG